MAGNRRAYVLAAGVAALAVVVSGCGSSTAAAPRAAAAVKSCDLLSSADIHQLTGLQLPAGKAASAAQGWSLCNWEDADARAGVQVQLHAGDAREIFQQRRQELASAFEVTPQPVRIAGATDAYEVRAQGTVGVLVGDEFIQLSTVGSTFGQRDHLGLAALVIKGLAA